MTEKQNQKKPEIGEEVKKRRMAFDMQSRKETKIGTIQKQKKK